MSSTNESSVGLTDIGAQSSSPPPTASIDEITTWREKISASIARSRKVRGGNFVQIATVDPETLEPRCRTVVFRGFLKQDGKETDIMKMITDQRSKKYSEVTAGSVEGKDQATCEMVWWFGKTSEQYRIRGHLKFFGNDETDAKLLIARKEQWGNMSDSAREQFYWKNPGLPFDSQAEVPEGGRDEEGKVLSPPDNFLLMLLYPTKCDYLRLGDNFRQIDNVTKDQSWNAQQVTP
jgi:PPOX class probable FMN-dependent enzyme